MPSRRYFFNIQGPGRRYDDEGGTPLADDNSALSLAEKIIGELNADGDYRGCRMIVQDGLGRTVFSLAF